MKNYTRYFKALYYFDAMLGGSAWIDQLNDTNIHVIISNLINGYIFKDKNLQNKYGGYMNDTFRAYINNKTQIIINFHYLRCHFKDIMDLVVKNVFGQYGQQNFGFGISTVYNNFFRPIILRLFPNLKSIILIMTDIYGDHEYKIDIEHLVSFLDERLLQRRRNRKIKITIRATHRRYHDVCWLSGEWKKLEDSYKLIHNMSLHTNTYQHMDIVDMEYGFQ